MYVCSVDKIGRSIDDDVWVQFAGMKGRDHREMDVSCGSLFVSCPW
jgi:hypothetical protein